MTERIKDFHIVILLYYYHDTDITESIRFDWILDEIPSENQTCCYSY